MCNCTQRTVRMRVEMHGVRRWVEKTYLIFDVEIKKHSQMHHVLFWHSVQVAQFLTIITNFCILINHSPNGMNTNESTFTIAFLYSFFFTLLFRKTKSLIFALNSMNILRNSLLSFEKCLWCLPLRIWSSNSSNYWETIIISILLIGYFTVCNCWDLRWREMMMLNYWQTQECAMLCSICLVGHLFCFIERLARFCLESVYCYRPH